MNTQQLLNNAIDHCKNSINILTEINLVEKGVAINSFQESVRALNQHHTYISDILNTDSGIRYLPELLKLSTHANIQADAQQMKECLQILTSLKNRFESKGITV